MADNPLLAVIVLLVVAVALVPLFKWLGLGTVLGYLVAGIAVGPFGFRLINDAESIRSVSEFGVVIMLFLIGLEVKPRELWHLRDKLFGMGLPQLLASAGLVAAVAMVLGSSWQAATIIGLSIAMSSTAIAMQTIQQRSITATDTGRTSLVVLLVQDLAVIPILALIPILAVSVSASVGAPHGEAGPSFAWWTPIAIIVGFVVVVLASRFLVNPLMRWVAMTKVPEAFTALGLLLVIGAAFATQSLGLSPAMGAFIGGVLLADSEYRHELESNLEPFKGLLLGLFFITVGVGIAFGVLLSEPLKVLAIVAVVIGIKIAVLYVLASIFRMHIADRLLLAILLSQAGEFAFVLLSFARSASILPAADAQLWAVVVALSMALTPFLVLAFDRFVVPRLNTRGDTPAETPSDLPEGHRVLVLGYGRFGQIVTRLLRAQGYSMTLIDDDPAQIELVKRFGVKVFYGDGGRLDMLRVAGAAEAEMIVVAVASGDRIIDIVKLIRRHFPRVKIAARAIDRSHAHQLMSLGVDAIERETFRGAIALGEKALRTLGTAPDEAHRLARAFEEHDERLLSESYELREDRDAYIGFVRKSTEMLDRVMQADREQHVSARQEPLSIPTPPVPAPMAGAKPAE